MVRHPDVARRAQEAIDEVTGGERLPTFDDRKNIPYIDCLLKEVLRYALALAVEMVSYLNLSRVNPPGPGGKILFDKEANAIELSLVGVPHRLMKDDEHDNKTIPSGSIVVPNIWYEIKKKSSQGLSDMSYV